MVRRRNKQPITGEAVTGRLVGDILQNQCRSSQSQLTFFPIFINILLNQTNLKSTSSHMTPSCSFTLFIRMVNSLICLSISSNQYLTPWSIMFSQITSTSIFLTLWLSILTDQSLGYQLGTLSIYPSCMSLSRITSPHIIFFYCRVLRNL
jgi:hypothetical protein